MSRIRTVNLSQASRWQGRRAVCADEAESLEDRKGRKGRGWAEHGLICVQPGKGETGILGIMRRWLTGCALCQGWQQDKKGTDKERREPFDRQRGSGG